MEVLETGGPSKGRDAPGLVPTTAVRSALARHYAPATANKMLSALRGVLTKAWWLGHMGRRGVPAR